MLKKNLFYLIGMPGVGKTTIGKKLAKELSYKFIDLDQYIEEKLDRDITNIFKKDGEGYFRKKESYFLKEVSKLDSTLIATGGGVVTGEKNIDLMKKTGQVIFLDGSYKLIKRNILKGNSNRPLLEEGDLEKKLEKLYRDRIDKYLLAADYRVEIREEDSVEDIVLKVIEKINMSCS